MDDLAGFHLLRQRHLCAQPAGASLFPIWPLARALSPALRRPGLLARTTGFLESCEGYPVDRRYRPLLPRPAGLVNRESDQAGAKQDKAGNGHSEETVRSEFFTHGTPPVVCPGWNETTVPPHSQKNFRPTPNFDTG